MEARADTEGLEQGGLVSIIAEAIMVRDMCVGEGPLEEVGVRQQGLLRGRCLPGHSAVRVQVSPLRHRGCLHGVKGLEIWHLVHVKVLRRDSLRDRDSGVFGDGDSSYGGPVLSIP